jgi:hypothetical protein
MIFSKVCNADGKPPDAAWRLPMYVHGSRHLRLTETVSQQSPVREALHAPRVDAVEDVPSIAGGRAQYWPMLRTSFGSRMTPRKSPRDILDLSSPQAPLM